MPKNNQMNFKKYLIIALLAFASAKAQSDKIKFTYDAAGNQTHREICLKCTTAKPTKALKDLEPEDYTPLEESLTQDQVSYYPNPVQEELHIKWELINDRKVTAILVFMTNGQVVQTYTNTSTVQLQTLAFGNLPAGVYLIMMQYSDGKEKTFKIIKK
jgi:hypothetical protein